MRSKVEQIVVRDWDRKSKVFEDVASAVAEIVRITNQERMSTLIMPDGKEFTILERPRQV